MCIRDRNNTEEENEFMGGFILPTSHEEEDKYDDDFFRGITYTDQDVEPEFTDDYDINAVSYTHLIKHRGYLSNHNIGLRVLLKQKVIKRKR